MVNGKCQGKMLGIEGFFNNRSCHSKTKSVNLEIHRDIFFRIILKLIYLNYISIMNEKFKNGVPRGKKIIKA